MDIGKVANSNISNRLTKMNSRKKAARETRQRPRAYYPSGTRARAIVHDSDFYYAISGAIVGAMFGVCCILAAII